MDTVWIRLTLIDKTNGIDKTEYQEYFMFGPTGIVRFFNAAGRTILYRSNDVVAAEVKETGEYIFDILKKIRGTEGRLDGSKNKKAKTSKRSSSPSKKKK